MNLAHRQFLRAGWITAIQIAVCLLIAPEAGAEIAGHWRVERPPAATEVVDITETDGQISFTYLGSVFTGAPNGNRLMALGDVLPGFQCHALFAVDFDNQQRFSGMFFDADFTCFGSLNRGTLWGERCECFDGNSDNGDGCDATCRIERTQVLGDLGRVVREGPIFWHYDNSPVNAGYPPSTDAAHR